MVSSTGAGRPLVVLQSFRRPRATSNPYVHQLLAALSSVVEVRTFTWRRALFGRYDVLHLHWPDLLVVGTSAPKTVVANVLFLMVLLRVRWRRVALVRTVHNVRPHEPRSKAVARTLRRADAATTSWISMTGGADLPARVHRELIPHGHYEKWFADYEQYEPIEGRIVYFGLIRAYKGVERLVEAFAQLPDDSLTLRIMGKPDPRELGDRIEAMTVRDRRVCVDLGYVDDRVLAAEVSSAELVALPYAEMLNSGALLLALSLGRPVLVPSNAANDALAEEVGAEWVRRYSGALTPEDLDIAVRGSRGVSGRPDLSARAWEPIALAHKHAYRRAVSYAREAD